MEGTREGGEEKYERGDIREVGERNVAKKIKRYKTRHQYTAAFHPSHHQIGGENEEEEKNYKKREQKMAVVRMRDKHYRIQDELPL